MYCSAYPAASALAVSAERLPANRSATTWCIPSPPSQSAPSASGFDVNVGVTTMLLVSWANRAAV